MPRLKGRRAEIRFDDREKAKINQIRSIPDIRDAVDQICRKADELHAQGWDFTERWSENRPRVAWGIRNPFGRQEALCRRHGLHVWVTGGGTTKPTVHLSLMPGAAQEGLAARIQYPQNLLTGSNYDIWEIDRAAPLARVLEDIEVQWRRLHLQRAEWGLVSGRRRRGRGREAFLRAIDAYRARSEGKSWDEIARNHGRHRKTAETLVRNLCRKSGLPWPKSRAAAAGFWTPPDCAGENCPKRPGLSEPCRECPWISIALGVSPDVPQGHRLLAHADLADLEYLPTRRRRS